MRRLIWILFFFTGSLFAAQMVTKVIELHYQQADNVIQLIQPLLSQGEAVSGSGQTLILKVTPDTLTQLREVLHKLDQPPVTFEIAVFQGDPDWLSTQNSNTISISTSSNQNQQRYQSVKVMNGESAFISTGEDQPVISNVGIGFWSAGVSYDRRLVQTGLMVEPLLQGQKVRLSVKRIREQDTQVSDQSFNQQQVMTTVMLPLNEWVPLGTAQGEPAADQNTEVIRAGTPFTQNSTLYIKVKVVGKSSSGIEK
ncbi:type II/III secretion system protein [Legionella sp. 16cNR16C]|uniref:type II/III secretion system protein n=1 Tax=Legionella sp. 16cNR16C TaxID=2905656 RepID=UPI001E61D9FB|nr:type II/III secretion system protein [Legionella sp. 16cNR16C]MCE3043646.1 type II/III secretion system protein [Legionella sp. 16cNR16C]